MYKGLIFANSAHHSAKSKAHAKISHFGKKKEIEIEAAPSNSSRAWYQETAQPMTRLCFPSNRNRRKNQHHLGKERD
jgi:hypothetical protein